MRIEGNGYYIDNKSPFIQDGKFKITTVSKVFDFAYEMSFGKDGEHRKYRSGGQYNRRNGQIFINTFQGKLAEYAVHSYIRKHAPWLEEKPFRLDLDAYSLGDWDDHDLELKDLIISIKSTSSRGNLLLLETKDWNNNGEYMPNINNEKSHIYDYFILVRIEPDGKKVMKRNQLFYANDVDREHLWNIISAERWESDIVGYIELADLRYAIKNNFVLPQGATLNEYTKMDAENYYVQSGDMKDLSTLIKAL